MPLVIVSDGPRPPPKEPPSAPPRALPRAPELTRFFAILKPAAGFEIIA